MLRTMIKKSLLHSIAQNAPKSEFCTMICAGN